MKVFNKMQRKKVLLLGNTIVPILVNEHYDIQLYVTLEGANEISKVSNCPLHDTM